MINSHNNASCVGDLRQVAESMRQNLLFHRIFPTNTTILQSFYICIILVYKQDFTTPTEVTISRVGEFE